MKQIPKIPKKIILLNQDIKIIFDNKYCNERHILGEADVNHNSIKLCSVYDKEIVPFHKQRHALFHELTHFLLFVIGQSRHSRNEVFVDNLATAMEDLILKNNFDKTLK